MKIEPAKVFLYLLLIVLFGILGSIAYHFKDFPRFSFENRQDDTSFNTPIIAKLFFYDYLNEHQVFSRGIYQGSQTGYIKPSKLTFIFSNTPLQRVYRMDLDSTPLLSSNVDVRDQRNIDIYINANKNFYEQWPGEYERSLNWILFRSVLRYTSSQPWGEEADTLEMKQTDNDIAAITYQPIWLKPFTVIDIWTNLQRFFKIKEVKAASCGTQGYTCGTTQAGTCTCSGGDRSGMGCSGNSSCPIYTWTNCVCDTDSRGSGGSCSSNGASCTYLGQPGTCSCTRNTSYASCNCSPARCVNGTNGGCSCFTDTCGPNSCSDCRISSNESCSSGSQCNSGSDPTPVPTIPPGPTSAPPSGCDGRVKCGTKIPGGCDYNRIQSGGGGCSASTEAACTAEENKLISSLPPEGCGANAPCAMGGCTWNGGEVGITLPPPPSTPKPTGNPPITNVRCFHDYNNGTYTAPNCSAGGWANDPDHMNEDTYVRIFVDGVKKWENTAGNLRDDLKTGCNGGECCTGGTCGFNVDLYNGKIPHNSLYHPILAQAQDMDTGEWVDCGNSPKSLMCAPSCSDLRAGDPVITGSNFQPNTAAIPVKCNFGVSDISCIHPGGWNGDCSWNGWSGTDATFGCKAPASGGTYTSTCNLTVHANCPYTETQVCGGTQYNVCSAPPNSPTISCVAGANSVTIAIGTGSVVNAVNYHAAISSLSPSGSYVNGLIGNRTGSGWSGNIWTWTYGSVVPGQLFTGSAYAVNNCGQVSPTVTTNPATCRVQAESWWQTKGADVWIGGDMPNVNVPVTFVADGKYFDLDGLSGIPGIPVYSSVTTPGFGAGTVSSKDWLANTTYKSDNQYSYDDFFSKLPGALVPQSVVNIDETTLVNPAITYKGYGYFKAQNVSGPVNISDADSTVSLGANKIVVFVDGDLNIASNIDLTNGSGFVTFIVKGNITVDPAVISIKGIFFANGSFFSGSGDQKLSVRGSLIAWNGPITFGRDLLTGNNTSPAEYVEYAPDQFNLFPAVLGDRRVKYTEIPY